MKKVMQALKNRQLYLKAKKCDFAKDEIMFLGHVVGHGQVKMDTDKVKAIREWPAQGNISSLRSFLGLANYYRRFIKGYSNIVTPLTDLLQKDKL